MVKRKTGREAEGRGPSTGKDLEAQQWKDGGGLGEVEMKGATLRRFLHPKARTEEQVSYYMTVTLPHTKKINNNSRFIPIL